MANEVQTSGEEEALMSAARAYSKLNERISTLESQLRDALVALEGRNERIKVLDQALADQKNNHDLELAATRNDARVARASRDEALHERDQMRVVFASFKAQLDALELPLAGPPKRRSLKQPGKTQETAPQEESTKKVRLKRAEHPDAAVFGDDIVYESNSNGLAASTQSEVRDGEIVDIQRP